MKGGMHVSTCPIALGANMALKKGRFFMWSLKLNATVRETESGHSVVTTVQALIFPLGERLWRSSTPEAFRRSILTTRPTLFSFQDRVHHGNELFWWMASFGRQMHPSWFCFTSQYLAGWLGSSGGSTTYQRNLIKKLAWGIPASINGLFCFYQ